MGKNRDKLGIIGSILEAVNSGSTKTGIMFQANLSFKLLEKYIEKAENAGLLSFSAGKYFLTNEGKSFLSEYRVFAQRYSVARDMLSRLSVERDRLSRLCDGVRSIEVS